MKNLFTSILLGISMITVQAQCPSAVLANQGDNKVCNRSSTDLSLTLTGVAPFTYTYNSPRGGQVTVMYASAGTHDLTVTESGTYSFVSLTDQTACAGTGSGTAVVEQLYRPAVDVTLNNNGIVCGRYQLLEAEDFDRSFIDETYQWY